MPVPVVADFLSLLFPRYCQGCAEPLVKGEDILCTKCIHDLPRTDHLERTNNEFYSRIFGRVPIRTAAAFLRFEKSTLVQHLLHALKYRNLPEVGIQLGHVFGTELLAHKCTADLIIPVPLHSSKQRSRGYNQSEAFARGLSESMNIPLLPKALVRHQRTKTQTHKTRLQRWDNVRQAFSISDAMEVNRKHVLLIDDVVTTGATLEACAQVLLKAGCHEVSLACIAVA